MRPYFLSFRAYLLNSFMSRHFKFRPAAYPTWLELAITCLVAFVGFASIPVLEGEYGLSWDALNHHIYLGWVAESPRFDKDFYAASGQSYQFPYLYWPIYKMAVAGLSGVAVGIVFAAFYVLAIPPVWMIARSYIPDNTPYGIAMRACATLLAFLSSVTLSFLDISSNDFLAALPLLWSVALVSCTRRQPGHTASSNRNNRNLLLASALLAGASVAFKLSNAPLAVFMPILWYTHADPPFQKRMLTIFLCCTVAALAFVLIYAYWGWLLWRNFGNPFYPFFDGLLPVAPD
ncbi:hypothetical protein PY257_08380 [Ramlibacter sp. H39-3-26]|uniref:hypothetical protein n=1 Tax=Curvibacter soli TaxID=3031331 RepID=UPI0023D9E089|nr:hypothetical protein [Ramlibacter sp. H39-3-26]MDF1485196.1 hypothetical protein [Ramlibacter sp. H39-3-26]